MPELLVDPDGRFSRNYNRSPFQFPHGLKGDPLFELPSLVELAKRMPDHSDTYWSNGKVDVTDAWGVSRDGRRTLVDTIAGIETNNSLVIIKHTEQDPVYGPVLQKFLGKVVEFAGEQMRSDVAVGEVLILISSPNRITPYHIDGECNYVVQVAGDKTLSVFDQTDPSLVSDDVIERFHAGDWNSAPYDEESQSRATVFALNAGTGVHIPLYAPHWVRNHDNVSVALSVTYELHSVQRASSVHKMNYRLRKLGINPKLPGVSPWRDSIKAALADATLTARDIVMRKQRAPYPLWTPSS
ncbi:transcription factor jumonji JmjC domain protein [Methylocella silvestris BL2]|uniref:Transcription factor jumonji JmjC domain protein n=1 Tax=Methylocella silvestris (strain DSM 15510 / CIP 108128 / LMG 27833 / NCIMB 13906 / BL2) TaxID=395965 RepID=B8EKA6_METSB|nr:hypothetical protein [Methylocella silvestris]ACK50646.1 transcription factor jumonji JmjC domain protein [Methylocella silvestris BL2]